MKRWMILLFVVGVRFSLFAGDSFPLNLGSGQPGLKIMDKGTNQFVIYLDEPWTVGVGSMGGYYDRHIVVLFDRNYGLKEMIRTRTWDGGAQQLYPFDDQRAFTCDVATNSSNWPHQTQMITINGDSPSISDDVYALARQQYGLTTNQYFLGKIGTNIFYWEMGDPRKAYCRPIGEKEAAIYFELPKGMIDLFGVTKGVKKDIGFVVFKKSTRFFSFSYYEFVFLEFSFKDAKQVKDNK